MNATPSRVIEVVVASDGSSTVTTRGFTGGECRDASRFLEAALGSRKSELLTGEYFQGQTTQADQQVRHRS